MKPPVAHCPLAIQLSILTTMLAVASLVAVPAALATPNVTCGQTFSGERKLGASCFGDIEIDGGKLDLAGHTVHGSIYCRAQFCEVTSDPPNGRVEGDGLPNWSGIAAVTDPDTGEVPPLAVSEVIVSGFGVGISGGNLRVSDSLVAGNTAHGIEGTYGVEVTDTIVSLNGNDGVRSQVGGVTVSGGTISENGGSGIRALEGVIVVGAQILDNQIDGVQNFAAAATVADSTVTGNGRHGVRTDDSDCFPSDLLQIADSDVTGNRRGKDCGQTGICADVVSCELPEITGSTTCETSYRTLSGTPGESWGICSRD
jgi:hypothetical protein